MNDLSVPTYATCFYYDASTKQLTRGTYNFTEFLKAQAEMAAEDRKNPVGTGTLTTQEICELAEKYDPHSMSQSEYNALISYLQQKNVLSRNETYDIGRDYVCLRPGQFLQGSLETVSSRSSARTLKDANGNAVDWTKWLLQMCGSSTQNDRIKAGALKKVNSILQQMDSVKKAGAAAIPGR